MSILEQQRWHIFGAGAVGCAFARMLTGAGAVVYGTTRSEEGAMAASLAVPGFVVRAGASARQATHVLVTVPDDRIAQVTREALLVEPNASVWLHASGAMPARVLIDAGVSSGAGACHPLRSFPARDSGSLAGATFGVDGDAMAMECIHHIAQLVDGISVVVPASSRPLYHAAAVLASNGVFGLVEAAERLCAHAGLHDPALTRAMSELTAMSASNAAQRGHVAACTGPVVRGDAGTVAMHRAAMTGAVDLDAVYVALSRMLISVAESRGVRDSQLAAMRVVLESVAPDLSRPR